MPARAAAHGKTLRIGGVWGSSEPAIAAALVPAARIGFAFGFITAFSNLGNIVGPAVAGAIRDRIDGWALVWAILAAAATLGAAAALLIGPPPQEADQGP